MEDPNTLYLMFGRLEGKVDALLSSQARADSRLADVETRLTNLETLKHQGTGMVRAAHVAWATIAACAGMFSGQIKDFLVR